MDQAISANQNVFWHDRKRREDPNLDCYQRLRSGSDCQEGTENRAEFEALDTNVKAYGRRIALYAGEDGLDVYRRIIEKVDQFLKADAALMLEIGYAQGQAVRELLEQAGCFGEITVEKDFHNNDRIVSARKISS